MNHNENDQIQQPKALYGATMDSRMNSELDWNSWRILDCFRGLWNQKKNPSGKVFISNHRLAEGFNISESSVKRAVNKLEKLGYIRRVMISKTERTILPGVEVINGKRQVTDEPRGVTDDLGGGSHMTQGGVTDDLHKPYKDKPFEVNKNKPSFRYALGKRPDTKCVAKHVYLTVEEYKTLTSRFGKQLVDKKIKSLANQIAEGLEWEELGRKNKRQKNPKQSYLDYVNHYRAIGNWCADEAPDSPTPGKPKKIKTAAGYVSLEEA